MGTEHAQRECSGPDRLRETAESLAAHDSSVGLPSRLPLCRKSRQRASGGMASAFPQCAPVGSLF